jgi:hypothetical protein
VALAVVILAVLMLAGGILIYQRMAPSLDMVPLQLGASDQAGALPDQAAAALWWDFVLILGYGSALLLGTTAALWVFWTPTASRWAGFGRWAAVATIVFDCIENVLLLIATSRPAPLGQDAWLANMITAAATIKFSCAVPAALVAALGIMVTFIRCFARRPKPRETTQTEGEGPKTEDERNNPLVDVRLAPAGDPKGSASRWRRAYFVPDIDDGAMTKRKAAGKDVTGICLSGGGIRSASVAMGFLQGLRTELLDADYLVSVSGGGYTAGAFQQLLTDAGDPPKSPEAPEGDPVFLHNPKHAFASGTVEVDHVRRNSSYIADTPWAVVVAMGVLVRGLLASIALLFSPALVLGVLIGLFYRVVPLTVLCPQSPAPSGLCFPGSYPVPRSGSLYALAFLVAVAAVLWLASLVLGPETRGAKIPKQANPKQASAAKPSPNRMTWRLRRASILVIQFAIMVAAATLAIPALVWVSGEVLTPGGATTATPATVGGPVGVVVLTFVSSLVSIGWKKRAVISQQAKGLFGRGKGVTTGVPNGLLQRLLVIVTVTLLAAFWLLLLGASVATRGERGALIGAAAVALFILVLGGLFDETALSLHPFYRRRLASAFAVRAVSRDKEVVAEPYDPYEGTSLATYGRVADGVKFPEVIFAAAANLTGEQRTPPGLNCVSYTMSANWVGGPDVGYARTEDLPDVLSARLSQDVTVQAAVAISGAAFASSMGRAARWFQILFAVSGARLGAWLPNPGFLSRSQDAVAQGNWALPGLPRVRRMTYLLREVLGIHPAAERLLQITDGGHYENLGLVELFRRRCTVIYCVDAGGDSPPSAAGLSEALTLAREELGVDVKLTAPWSAEPGGGPPLKPETALSRLNATLSNGPIIRGKFTYPPESGVEKGVEGTLIVAKALLWPKMSYPLLSYAAQHPVFPHDSTGDQWFDDGQFSAYTQLGRELAPLALKEKAAAAKAPAKHAVPKAPVKAAAGTRKAGQPLRASKTMTPARHQPNGHGAGPSGT